MKNKALPLIIGLVVVVAGYFVFFNKPSAPEKDSQAKDEPTAMDLRANELAARYHATADWDEGMTYTVQAQEKLLTGEPFLFRGNVEDIFNRDGKSYLRFSSGYYPEYVLEVECDKQILAPHIPAIGSRDPAFFDEYGLVATISELTKPVIALTSSVVSEEESEIDVDDPDILIGTGKCIALENLGSE